MFSKQLNGKSQLNLAKELFMDIKRISCIRLIGCILFFLVLPVSAGAKETLSVLSYNIHMWESSVETLTGVIKAANPDIVVLQVACN
jgi:hypothetical protein